MLRTLRHALLLWLLAAVTALISSELILTLGEPAAIHLGNRATAEAIASFEHQHGLDAPLATRVLQRATMIATLHFGPSIHFGINAADLLWERVPTGASLAAGAVLLEIFFGLLFGLLGGLYANRRVDRILLALTAVLTATPTAALALACLALLLGTGAYELPTLLWPILILGLHASASSFRITRQKVIETLSTRPIEGAMGRGFSPAEALIRYGLGSVAWPTLTYAALGLPGLLSGAVLVEAAFGLNGIGRLTLTAIQYADGPLVSAIVFWVSLLSFATAARIQAIAKP